ncbi:STAS domain-containing protein [Nocardioides sp. KR10-350]|uniref:STAS domain-containing protein n=1 Tax=Nocardioides cheoyonin TaxID=3156615 RepID=UPI0032B522AF
MDIQTVGPTLVLSGDFDVRSTWEVRNAIYDHLESHHDEDVVVDLSAVTTVDVTALKVLAVATRRALAQGQQLTVRGCGPAVRRMLHLSRLYPALHLESGLISA